MLVHTKKPPTKVKHLTISRSIGSKKKDNNLMILVSCPTSNADRIKHYLEKQGCEFFDNGKELVNAKGLFAERTSSNMLIGARGKESLSQIQLSELTGIPRRHISDMENGRRPIGKQNAMKLGKALNVNYRVFL